MNVFPRQAKCDLVAGTYLPYTFGALPPTHARLKAKPIAPSPEEWPKEAGPRPDSPKTGEPQGTWTIFHPSKPQVKISVVCEQYQKAFKVNTHPDPKKRYIAWQKNGGVRAAWKIAKERAKW